MPISTNNWPRWALSIALVLFAVAAFVTFQASADGPVGPSLGAKTDTDGDTVPDREDSDDDNDGLTDTFEAELGTNPLRPDSDGDTIPDDEEILGHEGHDPATGEPRVEFTDPNIDDMDGDGYTDGYEREQGTDPNDPGSYPGSSRAEGRPPRQGD